MSGISDGNEEDNESPDDGSELEKKANGKYAKMVQDMVSTMEWEEGGKKGGKKKHVDIPEDMRVMIWFYTRLLDTEHTFQRKLQSMVSEQPIYNNYLKHIRGIGPVFAANLLTIDISKYDTISKLWADTGYSAVHWESVCTKGHHFMSTSKYNTCPVRALDEETKKYKVCGAGMKDAVFINAPMKRRHGWVMIQNRKRKMTIWKIVQSFIKQPAKLSWYRRFYDAMKAEELKKVVKLEGKDELGGKGITKGHANNRAIRKVAKRFLANFFIIYRQELDLPVGKPYITTHPPHTYEEPEVDEPEVDDASVVYKTYKYTEDEKKKLEEFRAGLQQNVDSFYQLQKLRIQAFNRIVDYVATKYKPKE